ncbi:hypothetical protein Ancab_023657 [Ancistrocladus abbreviatus]
MSKRREDLVTKSSALKSRDRRVELRGDLTSGADVQDKGILHTQRSLTPHRTGEGHRRIARRDGRSNSMDRREYEWHMDCGPGDRVQSRSPQIGRVQKRPHVVGRAQHSKYDSPGYLDYGDETNMRFWHGYCSDDRNKISAEDDYGERMLLSTGFDDAFVKNSMSKEGTSARQMVTVHSTSGLRSDHGETSRGYSTFDMSRIKDESDRYEDVIPPESRHQDVGGYYEDRKKYAYHPEDISYPLSPTSQLKDIGDEHLLKGNPDSSSGIIIKGEYSRVLHPYLKDVYRKRSAEHIETLGSDDYDEPHLYHRKDYETGHIRSHQCDICSSTRAEHGDYLYSKLRVQGNEHGYIYNDELHGKLPSYVRGDHSHRDLPRAAVTDPMVESITEAEGSHRLLNKTGVRDVEIIRKERAMDYADMRRALDKSRLAVDHVDTGYAHSDFARMSELEEHGMPDSRLTSGYGIHANSGYRLDKIKSSPEFIDDAEMKRLAGRTRKVIANDHLAYNKTLKSKYNMDEQVSRINAESEISTEWSAPSGTYIFDDSGGEWTSGNSRGLRSKEPYEHERNHYSEAEQMFDEIYHHKGSISRSSNHSKPETIKYSGKSYKSSNTYLRGYKKYAFSKGSSHSHQRREIHKHRTIWKSEDDNQIGAVPLAPNLSEGMEGPLSHDQNEESEGFKQMVHLAFLNFYKKMNENPVARKLYRDQGKAGSLFCIVCRRSSSKEFLDTESLAKHAYMSHRVGLRAQHLGLHKAICVLMGWKIEVGPDMVTWAPQDLSHGEAFAQKEDLILWPPVVIVHNISLSNSNHKEWKVISTEALGTFLRAKGFTQGKVKICLGNPGDQSVMLVKFLGTFSGLHQAERLHQYFTEVQRGRTDFEQAYSNISNKSNVMQEGTLTDNTEESLLYGYMGIADDMDRVDFDTKKRCLIKSKKDIQDLVDGPVKPE